MTTDTESRYQQLVARLKGSDHRLTPQRMALLRIIASGEGHPSATGLYEQIKTQFPTTSLATVYKTLSLLKELGEVLELGFSNDDNRYDGNRPYPHPHLICVRCHNIMDPQVSLVDDLTQEVAELTGYQVISHRLDFYGVCPACRRSP
ncbi:MAG: transcriptional repressor [Anaerolineae bacterium]|nr:transcriptional repressor [Anaerolineae bacterium]